MAARSGRTVGLVVPAPSAVYGLDAGRNLARRTQRRRRRRNRILTSVLAIVLFAAVGSAGWVGYTAYIEHDTNEQIETDRRVAELDRERRQRSTEDLIEQLEQTPAWNGPGNPTFGIGDGTGP